MTLRPNNQQKQANDIFEKMQKEIDSLKAELKRKDEALVKISGNRFKGTYSELLESCVQIAEQALIKKD